MSHFNNPNDFSYSAPLRPMAQVENHPNDMSTYEDGHDTPSNARTPNHWNSHLEFPIHFFGRPAFGDFGDQDQDYPGLRRPPIGLPTRFPTIPPPIPHNFLGPQGFRDMPPMAAGTASLHATAALSTSSTPIGLPPPLPSPRHPLRHRASEEAPRGLRYVAPPGISPNYAGNHDLPSNQSAAIPDELNTSLWLTNLPPDCDHRMLLGAVRGCGKVYATVVNPPVATQNHITAASKLVFFDLAGARALMRQAREGLFAVGGYVPRVRHNRIRSEARPLGPQSRVLHVEGPDRVVNVRFLHAFFCDRFKFELEGVVPLGRFGDRARLEWRFGSYRCQAETARASIAREKERACSLVDIGYSFYLTREELEERLAWQSVTVHFAVDPCSMPPQVDGLLGDGVHRY